jgi:hypothetical protein
LAAIYEMGEEINRSRERVIEEMAFVVCAVHAEFETLCTTKEMVIR